MQVNVEAGEGLERRMSVQVPEERIANEVTNRLKSIARTARVHGFRPGKAPLKVLERSYGKQVREEVVSEVLQSSMMEALQQQALNPTAGPSIDQLEAEPGQGLSFTAVFEVYPEIPLPDASALELSRPVAEVTDADVDNMVQTLRRQKRTWEVVQRPAAEGDRLTVDYKGLIEGQEFKGNQASQVPVELGSGALIEGFEAALIGMSAGEERTLELSFPESYHDEEVAGKPVSFQVSVSKVEQPVLPEVDAAFIRSFGIEAGTEEALRQEVRQNMERELREALQAAVKQEVMDRILEANALELPRSLIESEAQRLAQQVQGSMGGQGASLNLPTSVFEEQAKRRVGLGLLLAELVKSIDLKPDPERVRARVESIASSYQEPEQVVKWYYGDRQRLSEVESMVMEDQLVEWVLDQAQVTEQPTTFDEIMKAGQTST